MFFQLVSIDGSLWVEGECAVGNVGRFAGPVVAIGVRDYDPVAAPREHRPASQPDTEGLLGWGTTHFLVCDPSKPAPVWVAKTDVRRHRHRLAEAQRGENGESRWAPAQQRQPAR